MSDTWSLNSHYVAVYTEDEEVMKQLSEEPKCDVMAEYYKLGKRFAIQYKIPRSKKQRIEELVGFPV